ncbi:hypothetical protein HMPREF9440_01420 [Sutterella parvirubra YIT 11816]|uniref:Uncharacterized protein n=1 Tax=Sutterella parvirubra YIT 11816 TaxID=762967 RepID=H3KFA3_9BURK|nr:hypothetical protein HMPREF9440_01420 [Sutterella parvirubra YIT 11816]
MCLLCRLKNGNGPPGESSGGLVGFVNCSRRQRFGRRAGIPEVFKSCRNFAGF